MVADNPVDIVVAHVGQCNIVSLQEGQTRIVILKIQGGTHSRRHLIDETENAVVAAGTVLIHELVLECDADFLVVLFFNLQIPFFPVFLPDREFQIGVVGLEMVIKNVLDFFPVDTKQFVSRFQFKLFGNTARFYFLYDVFRFVFHRYYVMAFPFPSFSVRKAAELCIASGHSFIIITTTCTKSKDSFVFCLTRPLFR